MPPSSRRRSFFEDLDELFDELASVGQARRDYTAANLAMTAVMLS